MNNVLICGMRSCLKKVKTPTRLLFNSVNNQWNLVPGYSRTLWYMCSANRSIIKSKRLNESYQSCCSRPMHAGTEKDLVKLLQNEISQEKESLKMKSLPAELEGFAITSKNAELTFTKKTNIETIIISMNVNHSVDTEEVEQSGDYVEEMKAKPGFEVDFVRSNQTLRFVCSFLQMDEQTGPDSDVYEINEITYFEGEWHDKVYAVAADLLDENLYDMFLSILNEKGVTMGFIEKVIDIATSYEHSQYISLLENVRKFATAN